jgi:hypothetical protein
MAGVPGSRHDVFHVLGMFIFLRRCPGLSATTIFLYQGPERRILRLETPAPPSTAPNALGNLEHDHAPRSLPSFFLYYAKFLDPVMASPNDFVNLVLYVGLQDMTDLKFYITCMCSTAWSSIWIRAQSDEAIISSLNRCFNVYRGTFLLNQICNDGLGRIFVPAMKILMCTILMASAFGLIRLTNILDSVTMAFLAVDVVAGGGVLMFGVLLMSNIYGNAVRFQRGALQMIPQISDRKERAYHFKKYRSCQSIRCKVGSFYSMEGKAKLTLADAVVNGVVSVLLIKI